MRVMVPRRLVIGRVNLLNHLLVFVPLLLLAARAVAVDQVAQVDDQGRLEGVDLRDEALEGSKVLALEAWPGVADYDKLELAGPGRDGSERGDPEQQETPFEACT